MSDSSLRRKINDPENDFKVGESQKLRKILKNQKIKLKNIYQNIKIMMLIISIQMKY